MDTTDITVICAWCATVLTRGSDVVSHGICNPCANLVLRDITNEFDREENDTAASSWWRLAV